MLAAQRDHQIGCDVLAALLAFFALKPIARATLARQRASSGVQP